MKKVTNNNVSDDSPEAFGLSCGGGLEWPGGSWLPGGEYVRKLKIQNISGRVYFINIFIFVIECKF